MEIKLLAAPLNMPEATSYIEKELEKIDPLYIMVDLNRLLEDGFSDKQIREFITAISKGSLNSLHIMQPKDNEYHHNNKWLESLYKAWNKKERVHWYKPSKMAEEALEE